MYLCVPDKKPPSDWPKNGEILFKDVHLAYSGTPVLRNLNFTIGAKAKIGIVGRKFPNLIHLE